MDLNRTDWNTEQFRKCFIKLIMRDKDKDH